MGPTWPNKARQEQPLHLILLPLAIHAYIRTRLRDTLRSLLRTMLKPSTLSMVLGLTLLGSQSMAAPLSCEINVPSQFATISEAVTSALGGQVICVAAGNYSDAFIDLATKGLILQGAQAGVDARTREARNWALGDPYPVNETVFTHSGGVLFVITGGTGATADGIFVRVL
jgi:hypothetical protein